MNTEPYPMDFAALRRGDTIPTSVIEQAVHCKPSSDGYRLKVLALRNMIRTWFLERHGDLVTIVFHGDTLRILTHPEQAVYAPERESKAVQQILIAKAEGHAVDMAQLTTDEQKALAQWKHKNAWLTQQMQHPAPPLLE